MKSIECQLCKESHRIWNCQHFTDKSVTERWNLTKLFHLRYCCLGERHVEKNVQEADSVVMKVAKNYITSYYIDSGTSQKLQSNVLLHIMILN